MAFSFGVFFFSRLGFRLGLGFGLGLWFALGLGLGIGFRLGFVCAWLWPLAFGFWFLAIALGFALARHTGPETNRKEEAKLFELIGTNRN